MKWLASEPATGENDSSSSSMLGNGHSTSPQMLRHPQNHHLGYDRWKVTPGKMPLQAPMMVPGQIPPPGVSPYDYQTAIYKQQELAYLSAMSAAQQQFMTPVPIRNGQIATSAKKFWGVEEHQKDDKNNSGSGGILPHHISDPHQMWRDPTWSTGDHSVTQPLSMGPRRSGSFPGSEAASILSPRSETAGLGVKMVEYVLSASPTSKDLEPQLRGLRLNGPEGKKDVGDKAPSPFDGSSQKDGEVPVSAQNGQAGSGQNGMIDDDKTYNSYGSTRTSGSRQPSPAEEQLSCGKQGGIKVDEQPSQQQQPSNQIQNHVPNNIVPVVVPVPANAGVVPGQVPMPHPMHHPAMHPPPGAMQHHHLQQQLSGLEGGPGGFDHHGMLDHNPNGNAGQQQQQMFDGQGPGSYGMMPQPPPQQPMDSPGLMNSFDIQALFRSQQNAPQQLQLLQQQQFLASQQQQQQLAAAAAQAYTTPNGAYLINPQEPYVGTLIPGPTVLPQYYGVAPWPMYPAGLLQPGAAAAAAAAQQQSQPQQRRPVTPSGGSDISNSSGGLNQQIPGQYQMIPYFPENGLVMGNVRGLSNAAPLRLVSPAPVLVNPGSATAGLGLGSNNNGRRDSFDRNTSAFSPSLDYGRGKWGQSYGALGTVAASPSPLGLTGGSLTPPPSLGPSSTLGALMSSGRVLSAAPGAEAKFRNAGALNALHNGHVFGTGVANGLTASGATSPGGGLGMSSSLFAKFANPAAVVAGNPIATNGMDSKAPGRSRMLEDFRNNRFPNLQLRDLTNHIVEFSQDQHGSRFIQQKLERAATNEKTLVFNEILAHAYALMTDVFGNYVIQKFFEFGTPEQKATLAQKVRGHVLPLALQMYGCRVIQKALETISADQQHEIVRELDGHVLKCVKDQNGNHVVQKCIECVDPHALQFIINAFSGQVFALSTHPYGCRVIQRILEYCTPEQTQPILEELHTHTENLIQDQYGNYVIQHVLEHGKAEDKSKIITSVRGKVLSLSQHKFASNVVEKCVTHAARTERSFLIDEVCSFSDPAGTASGTALQTMMKDQYANYVVQKMIDVAEPAQRKVLMQKIRPHLSSLRKYTYGKHIIAKLEKYFMKNTSSDLGPIGPPATVNPVAI